MNSISDEAFPDPADRATHESDRNLILRFRDRDRKSLSKSDEAVARLDSGVYGHCEECDKEIGLARLKARPVTRFASNASPRRKRASAAR